MRQMSRTAAHSMAEPRAARKWRRWSALPELATRAFCNTQQDALSGAFELVAELTFRSWQSPAERMGKLGKHERDSIHIQSFEPKGSRRARLRCRCVDVVHVVLLSMRPGPSPVLCPPWRSSRDSGPGRPHVPVADRSTSGPLAREVRRSARTGEGPAIRVGQRLRPRVPNATTRRRCRRRPRITCSWSWSSYVHVVVVVVRARVGLRAPH